MPFIKLLSISVLAVLLSACGKQDGAASGQKSELPKVEAQSGTLSVFSIPPGGKVFINGHDMGVTPADIKLGESEYAVEVIKSSGGLVELQDEAKIFVPNKSEKTLILKLEKRHSPVLLAALQKKFGGRAIEPEMAAIPAGSFRMGCIDGKDCFSDELPVRSLDVRAFELAKHEVTFDEWDACVADGGCPHWPDDRGWGRGKLPVINVSWNDIQAYLEWINKKTGKTYRLPTEAEWEYAARAGTTSRFSTGDCITTQQANFDGELPATGCASGEFRAKTTPVGSFAANPFGLFDMHGNVWEWTGDCWNESFDHAPVYTKVGPEGGCYRIVVRGGSWDNSGRRVRPAFRYNLEQEERMSNYGFRLAR